MKGKEIYALLNEDLKDVLSRYYYPDYLFLWFIKNGFSYSDLLSLIASSNKRKPEKKTWSDNYIYYCENRIIWDLFRDYFWQVLKDRKIQFSENKRTNDTQTLVMMAILWYSKYSGEDYPYCATRDMELLTGRGNRTVQKAARTLRANGFLAIKEKATKTTAHRHVITYKTIKSFCEVEKMSLRVVVQFLKQYSQYTIDDLKDLPDKFHPVLDKLIEFDSTNTTVNLKDLTDSAKDVFAHTGLNYRVKPLLEFINKNQNKEFTFHYLMERFNLSRYLLNSTLEKLREAGMCIEQSRKAVLFKSKFTTETSRIISVQRNTIGKEKKRKKIIASERKARKEAQEKWRKENEQK